MEIWPCGNSIPIRKVCINLSLKKYIFLADMKNKVRMLPKPYLKQCVLMFRPNVALPYKTPPYRRRLFQ